MGSIDPYKLLAFVVNDELFDVRWLAIWGFLRGDSDNETWTQRKA